MAIQGNLWAPAPEVTSVPDRISAYIAQRFPTPSITAGTLFEHGTTTIAIFYRSDSSW